MSEPTTAMVPADQAPPKPPVIYEEKQGGMVARWTENAVAVRTSLPLDTPQGKLDYIRCLTSPGTPLVELLDKEIRIKDWLVHEVEFPGSDGEVVNTLRLVFLTPEKQMITSFSTVVADNWSHVARTMGAKSFDPPVKAVFRRQKGTKPGGYIQLHSLEYEDSLPTTARKAK